MYGLLHFLLGLREQKLDLPYYHSHYLFHSIHQHYFHLYYEKHRSSKHSYEHLLRLLCCLLTMTIVFSSQDFQNMRHYCYQSLLIQTKLELFALYLSLALKFCYYWLSWHHCTVSECMDMLLKSQRYFHLNPFSIFQEFLFHADSSYKRTIPHNYFYLVVGSFQKVYYQSCEFDFITETKFEVIESN